MNIKRILPLVISTFWLTCSAQLSRQEIKDNILLSGSNYTAYYGPQKELSATPEGYTPYYISHYGRHGSRYLIGTRDYDRPVEMLGKAEAEGKLTSLGKETLEKCKLIREEARKRDGELTLRGAEQHRQIAHRMYERFPEVFTGKTHIDAKSSVVIRCILSMGNALQELKSLNPELDIRHDASEHDMWYICYDDKKITKLRDGANDMLREYNKRHTFTERFTKTLFNDEQYVKSNVDAEKLMNNIWKLACNLQSTELRHEMSLYNLFTEKEVYEQWQKDNAWWFVNFGNCKQSGGVQHFSQSNLLNVMLQEADSCLKMPHPGASLRYGHEVCVFPLTILLDLNGYGQQFDDPEQLVARNFHNYRIYPMGCNVQMIFYKPIPTAAQQTPKEDDILMKVLLNEDEATLPLKPVKGNYYRWTDFKKYYTDKLHS